MTLCTSHPKNSNVHELLALKVQVGAVVIPQDKEQEKTQFKVVKILCLIIKTKLNWFRTFCY